jgi:hypothetical protein
MHMKKEDKYYTMASMETINRYFRLAPAEIAYFKFILEGYEGVGIVTTCDRPQAVVRVMVMPDFQELFDRILAEVSREFFIEEQNPAAWAAFDPLGPGKDGGHDPD